MDYLVAPGDRAGCPPLSPGLWRARVPVVFFGSMTWVYPDRVMRQFGFSQPIPSSITEVTNVNIPDTSQSDPDTLHVNERALWDYHRYEHIVTGPSQEAPTRQYMRWFRSITRLQISVRVDDSGPPPHRGRFQPASSLLHAAVI